MAMEVKTLTLQDIANQVINAGDQNQIYILQQFLNQTPILTNYLIERKFTVLGLRPFVVQTLRIPRGPSTVPLSEHITIQNLTPECKVTLSPEQVQLVEQLL